MNSSLAHIMISFAGWAGDFSKKRLIGRFWRFMGMMVLCCGVISQAKTTVPSITANFPPGGLADTLYTVRGDPTDHSIFLNLESAIAGKGWTAKSSVSWLKINTISGVTPSKLQATFNVSGLVADVNEAIITITASDGVLNVPVHVHLDPLAITMLSSDPDSAKIYAISSSSATYTYTYLVEIDSLSRNIRRVLGIGDVIGRLVVQHGDNRIYLEGRGAALLMVDKETFNLDMGYRLSDVIPDIPVQFNTANTYPIAGGGAGRLIIESNAVSVLNIDDKSIYSNAYLYKNYGSGVSDASGRYYYHGDSEGYFFGLSKFDTDGNVIKGVKYVEIENSRLLSTVLIDEVGANLFWDGMVFDGNLKPKQNLGEVIYSISSDGRYAFSETKIYDVEAQSVLGSMPVTTKISAYNSMSGRLVVQNGSGLGFYNVVGPGAAISPKEGAVVESPGQLQWTAVPAPGVTGYRVYLGALANGVSQATTGSVEYLGEVADPVIVLGSALASGKTYYWRVDVVVGGEVAKGDVRSFAVAKIVPSVKSIDASTVQGYATDTVAIGLSTGTAGKSWTATSSSSWVKFVSNTGVTPSTLQVVLDASQLNTGLSQATITVTTDDGSLTLPVSLQVDPITITAMRADPVSAKVYAISEASAGSGESRAYLLEIDSLQRSITRVVPAGSNATDLAIHHGDNRIYIPNWNAGLLLAVDLDDFAVVRKYAVPVFSGKYSYSYVTTNCYRVSAGGPGRVVFESQGNAGGRSQGILNTNTGEGVTLSSSISNGAGMCDPTGRYYYSSGENSTTAGIYKYDIVGDKFSLVSSPQNGWRNIIGSRVVLVSDDASRVFWNGVVFSKDLQMEWRLGDNVYSISSDGRYAFSESKIYDIEAKSVLGAMPVTTKISAYNSMSGRLVVQNGSGLGFYNVVGPGEAISPKEGAVVESPGQLQWTAVPAPGVAGYRVYLGASANGVSQATTGSAEYLGQVTDPTIMLGAALVAGQTYYWRVDVLVGEGVAKGDVRSFAVAKIVPSVKSINASTVQGYAHEELDIGLSTATAGKNWTATSSASWIKFASNTGATPSTLQVVLDASQLNTGLSQATITVTTDDGSLTLPVSLQVDPLTVTVMKSDADSAKVYAISEASLGSGESRAYLLEIDSLQRSIARVVPVGSNATDLAIHHGDNRVYVTNRSAGQLLAVGLDCFAITKTYPVPLIVDSLNYRVGDVYEIAAGGPGRLMIEPELAAGGAQSFQGIFDTGTGYFVATVGLYDGYAGGGQYDPSGRFYYHGIFSPNSSGSKGIIKYDTYGDQFLWMKSASNRRVDSYGNSNYGSRTVVVSNNGQRVFWNGSVFKSDLREDWLIGADVFAATPDGSIAFGQQAIYDVTERSTLMPMPSAAMYFTYNATSDELIVWDGSALRFYTLKVGAPLPAPVLSVVTVGYDSVEITWTDTALESGFALQKRIVGTTDWVDASSSTIPAYSGATTASGLSRLTAYEFRLKANSPVATSTWSNIVTATTLVGPPIFDLPASSSLTVADGSPIHLVITASGDDNHYTVSGLPNGMSFNEASHTIIGTSNVVGYYVVTVSATNDDGTSSIQINLTIGATTQNAANGHYEGLTYGDELAVLGTWKLDRTDNRFTGTFNALGGTLTFFGGFAATGDVRRTSVNFGKYNEVVSGTAIWDRAIDRITLTISISGYGTATTLDGTGFVSSWNATSHPYTKPGVFTAVMLPDVASTVNEPEGEGFLTLTISAAGVVRVVGETALGEKVTWSGVAANNFSLPVYWQSGDAFLWGIITTVSDDPGMPPIVGTLAWGENVRPSRKAYGAGFTQGLNVLGNQFQGGSSVNGFFTNTNAPVLQLGGGGLKRIMKNLTQPFSLSGKGALLPPSNPYQVKLTINPSTGLVTGQASVTDPSPSPKIKAVKRTIAFRGIMVRNADGVGTDAVGGYFLLPDWDKSVRSGWMEITAP